MKRNLFLAVIIFIFAGCTSGSLTEQFFNNLAQSNGLLEMETMQHLQDGSAGAITPAGSKIFTNGLGYEIELKEANLHFHELNLISIGADSLCQGGFDQTIPIHEAHDLLGEDLLESHMGSALIPMVFFCQFELVLGANEPAQVKFHAGETHGDETAAEAFHLAGTWSLNGESGDFDFIGQAPVSILGIFKTEENEVIIEHPLHFDDGETEISVLFGTEYDALFTGVDFKSQSADAQLDTVYQNFPDALHQDISDHSH